MLPNQGKKKKKGGGTLSSFKNKYEKTVLWKVLLKQMRCPADHRLINSTAPATILPEKA